MLPAASRVRRSEDFTAILRSGRRAGRGPLVVHMVILRSDVTQALSLPSARAGFVVGKAVGNAVVRNRTRRRLRALVAARLLALPAGSRLVVRALVGAGDLSYDQLAAHLDSGLRRLTPATA